MKGDAMPNAQMNFRIDAELKKRGDERFARLGVTPSDAMRRLYECAARYDDESEEVLALLLKPEGLTPQEEGEQRAQAVDDFLASLQAQREAMGIPSGTPTSYPTTNAEIMECVVEELMEKAAARGIQ